MIVIATTPSDLAAVRSGLDRHGLDLVAVRSPHADRRLVLAAVGDRTLGGVASIVDELRDRGVMAVSRPDGGAALTAWRRDTAPVCIRDRVTVALAWSEHPRHAAPGLVELGHGGFGSGHHPSTRLMLEVLADRLTGGERVLDVGCGSGVLALAAVELGAATAHGVDRKSEAVRATVANAAGNGRAGAVTASGDDLATLDGGYEVVVANIARAGVAETARDLVRLAGPRGRIVVGGLTPAQVDPVIELLTPGREVERRTSDGWAVVVVAGTRR